MSHIAFLHGTLVPSPGGGADSLRTKGDRIESVGTADEVLAGAPPDVRVVELGGRVLAPGFHDAHFHFLQHGLVASRPSLAACRSRDELLDRVRDEVREHDANELLIFEDFDETLFPRPALPTRADLDDVAPCRPVVLRRSCGHLATANRPGLSAVAERAPEADLDFETGIFREAPVQALDVLFLPGPTGIARALELAQHRCFSLGITTACDFASLETLDRYRAGIEAADLSIAVNAYVFDDDLNRLEAALARLVDSSLGDGFPVRGIKIFADGSVGARTAALSEDYADRPGWRGDLRHGDAELTRMVRAAHERSLAVAVHAIGDRAIDQVLGAFEDLPRDERARARHRIEHFELPRDEHLDALASTGVRPCMQPNFVGRWAGPGGLYETALGIARTRRMNPLRRVLERDVGLFFGSDGMPASPLFGIRSAMGHPTATERLSGADAIERYTRGGADAVGRGTSGRLTPGAEADLVVLPVAEPDPAGPGPDRVDLTIRRGRFAYERDSA